MASFVFTCIVLVSAAVCFLVDFSSAAKEYQEVGLRVHNELRAKHKVPSLVLNDYLNDRAEECAEYYVKVVKGIDHSCKQTKTEQGEGAGENLYASDWSNNAENTQFKGSAESATRAFYSEIDYYPFPYEFSQYMDFFQIGHFTQLVWKGTKQLGIGAANDSERLVVVAIYYPPGNLMSDTMDPYIENVLPPVADSSFTPGSEFGVVVASLLFPVIMNSFSFIQP